jgi:2-dehydro-3-deoxyphosphogluconate aldolase/(4S)-4-hydroxy-2-oxoglutarate aldolase
MIKQLLLILGYLMMLKELQIENKIIPVASLESSEQAIAVSEALLEGGISVIEITLRTAGALDAIAAVKKTFPEMTVLAGTVIDVESMNAVCSTGVDGVISPAFSEKLVRAAQSIGVSYLPAVATPSEVLAGMEMGLTEFKLFPAAVVGGTEMLKALSSPMPQANFCPTGGLNQENFLDYLALPNVACVGGSWMMDKTAIAEENWKEITRIAQKSIAKIKQLES